MSTDPAQLWLNAAGRYPLLPKAEIIRLAKKRDTVKPGSKEYIRIVNKISKHNMRLVPSVVSKYISKRYGFSMTSDCVPDLLQQGYLGLRHAAEKYDGTRGFAFSTYAHCWIYQAVSRWHNAKDRQIHIPESSLREVLYIKKHGCRSGSKNGRIPVEILDCARAAMVVKSIDQKVPGKDDEEVMILDIMSDDNCIAKQGWEDDTAAKKKLAELMDQCEIHPQCQKIVTNYLHRGRMDIVAARLAMNPKTCRVLYNQAFRTMQERVRRNAS